MLKRKSFRRALSRLISGLFAVQILAAGFCLLTPESHAAEMQMPISADMGSHCDSDGNTASGHADHSTACAHCDLPDELVQSKVSTFNIDFDFTALAPVADEIDLSAPLSVDLAVRTPTGPPRSSSLLYQTTQRILI